MEILQNITLFTFASKVQFYDKFILRLDLSEFLESATKTIENEFSKEALPLVFIVIKCECFYASLN